MRFHKKFPNPKAFKPIKKICVIAILVCVFSNTAYCTQASTDYVQAKVEGLRSEMNSYISALQTKVDELPIVTPKLGAIYQGGIVFYLDGSKQHGLVVSLNNLNDEPGISWRNGEGGDRMINAKGKGLGAGKANTHLIVSQQTIDDQQGQFAALLAEHYEAKADGSPCDENMSAESLCYSGWYLPSIYELFLLQTQLNLSNGLYWSSTEANETQAFLMDFATKQTRMEDKSILANVRAIHAF